MCGRFTRANDFFSDRADQRAFLEQLGLTSAEPLPPSYNIAPTQQFAAVRSGDHDEHELVNAALGPRAWLGRGLGDRQSDDKRPV